MPIYKRHLRYGSFDRVRHSTNLLSFLNEQALRITQIGPADVFTLLKSNTAEQVRAIEPTVTP